MHDGCSALAVTPAKRRLPTRHYRLGRLAAFTVASIGGFTGGASSELQKHSRFDVAVVFFCIPDAEAAAVDFNRGVSAIAIKPGLDDGRNRIP
jgi:hypothetical protein